jgi:hypothetical protein
VLRHAAADCQTALLAPAGQVNSLTSFETDLPFEYYSMPFCKPPEGVHRAGNAANLGTVIMGIKLLNSQYNFTIMVRMSTHQQQEQQQQRQDSNTSSCLHHVTWVDQQHDPQQQ